MGWGNQLGSRLGEDKGTKKMMIVGLHWTCILKRLNADYNVDRPIRKKLTQHWLTRSLDYSVEKEFRIK